MTNLRKLHKIVIYGKKAMNEKSSGSGTVRERLSSAVSSFREKICEVHSGVDSENTVSGYGSHTLRVSSEGEPL